MRILLVTSHFFPEQFKANDMAFELERRGHDVTVLAPIPDYPQGKFYSGYGMFRKQRETINGVKVIRTTIIPRRDGSAKWLLFNYLSHTLFASLRAVKLAFEKKFDAVVVHETSPVMVGIPAVIVKRVQKIPLHFWVLDLWPDSLSAAGGINNKVILNIFGSLTKWLYRNSERILISSNGFRDSINQLGNFNSKIEYFPNWVDDIETIENNKELFHFPNGFNIVFTGNIGDAQDMPHILETAKLLRNTNINFIIVGNGRRKSFVENFIKENNLDNVFLPGSFPRTSMPFFYDRADVLFLALKDTPIFALTAPAKIQSYMDSGKPIVAMINGEGASLIKESDCGWTVPAEHSKELAELLLSLSDKHSDELREKGANGKIYSETYFNFKKCIDNLEHNLKTISFSKK